MALVLAENLVAAAAWGLATTGLLLLLLLLCSFFHRTGRSFSTQKMKSSPGLVRGFAEVEQRGLGFPSLPAVGPVGASRDQLEPLKLARLSSCERGAALPGGTPPPGEPREQASGPAVSGDLDNPAVGVPEWTPHPNAPSQSPQRTPEFLRHRQLPVLPRDTGTAAEDPAPDAEGPIYESIRYKSGVLEKLWGASSPPGDSPSPPAGDEPGVSLQEIMAQEEPLSVGSPSPIYAQVCKLPRAPQPHSPPEPQKETPPSLPEKCFDVA